MTTRLRRIYQVSLALLLVLGIGVLLALWQGGAVLRSVLETQLQTQLVPTLRLEAPLEWQLLPRPQIVVRGASLTEATGAVVLKLPELRVVLDGAGLIKGRVDIASVDIVGLDLALEQDSDGVWNAAKWLRTTSDHTAAVATLPVAGETRIDITNIKLSTGPLRPGERSKFTLNAHLDVPSVAIVGVQLETSGQLLFDLNHPVLEQLKLEGVGNIGDWSVTHVKAQAEQLALQVDTIALQANGLALDVAVQAETGEIALQTTLATLSGSATSWRGETLHVQAQGEQAQQVVNASLQSDEMRIDENGWALPAMTLDVSSSGTLPVVQLQLSGAAQLHAEQGSPQFTLTMSEAHAAVPHPADASKILELAWAGRAHYDLVTGSAAGEMAGSFDRSHFDGRWSYEPQAPTPLKVNASLDHLDLDQYLPPVEPGATSADPLDLALWRNWPVSADLRVGELRVQGFVSQQARVRLGDSTTDER